MASRLNTIFGHLNELQIQANNTRATPLPRWQNKPDDIVVIAARRTAIAKAKRGGFKV